MAPTSELPADVKRRRRVAAAVYLVILAVLACLLVWRLASGY